VRILGKRDDRQWDGIRCELAVVPRPRVTRRRDTHRHFDISRSFSQAVTGSRRGRSPHNQPQPRREKFVRKRDPPKTPDPSTKLLANLAVASVIGPRPPKPPQRRVRLPRKKPEPHG
jgi:hypothetical protein